LRCQPIAGVTADYGFVVDIRSLAWLSSWALGTTMYMEIPAAFRDYRCGDYFASERFVRGVWSEREQLDLIVAADKVAEQPDLSFLVVGRPGVDGIKFGYRKGQDGIWAYYPIGQEFMLVAPSVSILVDGWLSGSIKV